MIHNKKFRNYVRLYRNILFNAKSTKEKQLQALTELNKLLSKKREVIVLSKGLLDQTKKEAEIKVNQILVESFKKESSYIFLKNELLKSLGGNIDSESFLSYLKENSMVSVGYLRNSVLDRNHYSNLYKEIDINLRDELHKQLSSLFKFKDGEVFGDNQVWKYSDIIDVLSMGKLQLYFNDKHTKILENLLRNRIGFIVFTSKYMVGIEFPEVHLDTEGRLHNENGPAVKWGFGKELYFLEGVRLDKELYNNVTNKKISAEDLLWGVYDIENVEVRRIAIKYIGYENFLKDLEVKILDEEFSKSGVFYQVLETNLEDDNFPARFIKVTCPSSNKIYILRVKPKSKQTKTCRGSIAWTFSLKEEEYNLEEES